MFSGQDSYQTCEVWGRLDNVPSSYKNLISHGKSRKTTPKLTIKFKMANYLLGVGHDCRRLFCSSGHNTCAWYMIHVQQRTPQYYDNKQQQTTTITTKNINKEQQTTVTTNINKHMTRNNNDNQQTTTTNNNHQQTTKWQHLKNTTTNKNND